MKQEKPSLYPRPRAIEAPVPLPRLQWHKDATPPPALTDELRHLDPECEEIVMTPEIKRLIEMSPEEVQRWMEEQQ